MPSLIPKLFSPRNKDQEKLKRQDSRDDVRQIPKATTTRRESKEETRNSGFSPSYGRDEQKSGIRIFRRDSREDVGRETTSLPSLCIWRGKQTGKDEKQEIRTEGSRVGETISRSKSCPSEQGKTSSKPVSKDIRNVVIESKIIDDKFGKNVDLRANQSLDQPRVDESFAEFAKMANEKTMVEERFDRSDAKTVSSCEQTTTTTTTATTNKTPDKDTEEKEDEEEIRNLTVAGMENRLDVSNESIDPIIKEISKDISADAANCSETDFAGAIVGERKVPYDSVYMKKIDDMQVVRRKFSKEEFSNPDDTDETPNRRSSSVSFSIIYNEFCFFKVLIHFRILRKSIFFCFFQLLRPLKIFS